MDYGISNEDIHFLLKNLKHYFLGSLFNDGRNLSFESADKIKNISNVFFKPLRGMTRNEKSPKKVYIFRNNIKAPLLLRTIEIFIIFR